MAQIAAKKISTLQRWSPEGFSAAFYLIYSIIHPVKTIIKGCHAPQ